MIDFYIKKGDLLPVLRTEFQDADGNNINLSGASVGFNYKLRTTGNIVSNSAYIESQESGICQYIWNSGDTSVPGLYQGEFVITFANNKQMTFPPGSFLLFEVTQDIS